MYCYVSMLQPNVTSKRPEDTYNIIVYAVRCIGAVPKPLGCVLALVGTKDPPLLSPHSDKT